MVEPDKSFFCVWFIGARPEGVLDGQWAVAHEEDVIAASKLSGDVNLVRSKSPELFCGRVVEGGETTDVQGHILGVGGVTDATELGVTEGECIWIRIHLEGTGQRSKGG